MKSMRELILEFVAKNKLCSSQDIANYLVKERPDKEEKTIKTSLDALLNSMFKNGIIFRSRIYSHCGQLLKKWYVE